MEISGKQYLFTTDFFIFLSDNVCWVSIILNLYLPVLPISVNFADIIAFSSLSRIQNDDLFSESFKAQTEIKNDLQT